MSTTEAARFENASAPATIGRDCMSLVRFRSITERSDAGEEPIETDRTRQFCHGLATAHTNTIRRKTTVVGGQPLRAQCRMLRYL